MSTIDEQKNKLEQKKNRIALEEMRLREKERKARTRHLIEMGGLIVKADLDYLPKNTLYGALLSIAEELNTKGEQMKAAWSVKGSSAFNQENKNLMAIIIKFDDQPDTEIRQLLRSHGLRYNNIRQEWYGYVEDLKSLENKLGDIKCQLEIMK